MFALVRIAGNGWECRESINHHPPGVSASLPPSPFPLTRFSLEVELDPQLYLPAVAARGSHISEVGQRRQKTAIRIRSDHTVNRDDALDVKDVDGFSKKLHVESLVKSNEARITQVNIVEGRCSARIAP